MGAFAEGAPHPPVARDGSAGLPFAGGLAVAGADAALPAQPVGGPENCHFRARLGQEVGVGETGYPVYGLESFQDFGLRLELLEEVGPQPALLVLVPDHVPEEQRRPACPLSHGSSARPSVSRQGRPCAVCLCA